MTLDYKIRYITAKEVLILQNFIKQNYSKNHIMSKNQKIINFFYKFNDSKDLNFIGCFKKNKLLAVLGLTTTKNWDISLKKHYFISLMVKSSKIKNDVFFKFLLFVFKNIKPDFLGCLGFNKKIKIIFDKIGLCKTMKHYYIKNIHIKEKVSKNLKLKVNKKKNNLKFIIHKKLNKISESNSTPQKSIKYYNNKYSNNPFYKYFFINFYNKDKFLFFFVVRKIKIKSLKTNIMRIVDMHGNIKKNNNILGQINILLDKNKSEYIDFMNYGIDEKILLSIGFKKKNNKQLIPNFFEPFIKKNENLDLCILLNKYKKNVIINKADGDQERPNIV